jgi:hypothetical protein
MEKNIEETPLEQSSGVSFCFSGKGGSFHHCRSQRMGSEDLLGLADLSPERSWDQEVNLSDWYQSLSR